MKKLILQMQMTADGFVAGPEGQMDWMSTEMDHQQLALLQELTENMDTIVMGRRMTEGFAAYWEHVVDHQPDSPEYQYAKIFVDTPKIVFSKTVATLKGRNVTVQNGDLVESIKALKNQSGKNIIVYGGAHFVSELIKNGLIDELNLFVNPVAIGNGLRIFTDRTSLQLFHSSAYSNGIVVHRYRCTKI